MKATRSAPVALVLLAAAKVAGVDLAVALEMSAVEFQRVKARRFS